MTQISGLASTSAFAADSQTGGDGCALETPRPGQPLGLLPLLHAGAGTWVGPPRLGPIGRAETGRVPHAPGPQSTHSKAMSATKFPGIAVICDGSEAIASVETRISEGACSYPITPSTTMPAVYQAAVADGRTNLWGTPLAFLEPESEHSSATRCGGVRPRGRPRRELHRGPGPDPDEGGPLRHRRQAAAGRLPRRRSRADQPEPQHPCRTRRRDGRRRLRLGHPLRAQRAGGGRLHGHRPPRRGGDEHAVLRRAGRLPDDPHARERAACPRTTCCASSSAIRASASRACSTRPPRS